MLRKTLHQTIRKYSLIEKGDHVLVAVSGGADSVALLRGLHERSQAYPMKLTVAHFNHRLRGRESDQEEQFVSELAISWGLDSVCGGILPGETRGKGRSLEDWCRERRYAFLERTAKEIDARKIALGHHRQDQAETVLLNLLRGSGVAGMKGMMPIRDGLYIRPLLETEHEDILSFIANEGLAFMRDSSNQDTRHVRNRLRHELIPLLQASYNPTIVNALGNMAEVARLENDFVAGFLPEAFLTAEGRENEGRVTFQIPAFLTLHEALQNRLIIFAFKKVALTMVGISQRHVRLVRGLLQHPGHAEARLPRGVLVERSYERLTFTATPGHTGSRARGGNVDLTPGITDYLHDADGFCCEVPLPGILTIPRAGMKIRFEIMGVKRPVPTGKTIVYFDYDLLQLPLVCRSILPGDRMQPLGMQGGKKISRVFMDAKVPFADRGHIPLLVDGHSVLWIAGMRVSERVRVSEKTTTILKAEII